MSAEELPNRRSGPRLLATFPLALLDPADRVLDHFAKAHEVGIRGFLAETTAAIHPGDRFRFRLQLEDGGLPVKGRAQAVWVEPNPLGGWRMGAKITHLSWGDSRRLRRAMLIKGYDFAGVARMAWKMVYWAVVLAGVHAVLYHQPEVSRTIGELYGVIIAAGFLGLGLWLLIPRD